LITLTLVDLPGIARVPLGDQPEDVPRDEMKNHGFMYASSMVNS
jgi:replication fork clamp-binding protein CrfC